VELEEIDVFVRSVLAVADRVGLGLPDTSSWQPPHDGAVLVDGNLPADLQRYLERLVSVSSVTDAHALAAILWDDEVVIDDDDQEPHDALGRWYPNRGGGNAKRTTAIADVPRPVAKTATSTRETATVFQK